MPRDHVPAEVDRRVREAARHRCGYCLSPQQLVMARLEIEHIIPKASIPRRWPAGKSGAAWVVRRGRRP
jgi:hypothetical protein